MSTMIGFAPHNYGVMIDLLHREINCEKMCCPTKFVPWFVFY